MTKRKKKKKKVKNSAEAVGMESRDTQDFFGRLKKQAYY